MKNIYKIHMSKSVKKNIYKYRDTWLLHISDNIVHH